MSQSKPFEPEIVELPLSAADRSSVDGVRTFFKRLSKLDNSLFLDGGGESQQTEDLNRYSFLAADPIEKLTVTSDCEFELEQLRSLMSKFPFQRVAELPPFQGGIAGLISYEFNRRLEQVPHSPVDEFKVPQLALFVYDVVVAIDHQQQRAWLVSQGWPESDPEKRRTRARGRADFFLRVLTAPEEVENAGQSIKPTKPLAPKSEMNELAASVELYSDFSQEKFLEMIQTAVEYIHAGDVFQANLSQRLLTPATKRSEELYWDLRTANPAPFSAYFDFGDGQVVSASPERLVSMHDKEIETRPIKGTRRRTYFPEVDLNTSAELLQCEKDRAENTMIVDLMRNDLSRVAEVDSVRVSKLCGIEQFANVFHLVSVVHAKLSDQHDAVDLLASLFPGGSITGAPKIRAMEIIAELEPTARGAYCGSIGYLCPDGDLDFSILIRTITAKDGWWQIPVGGGIVSDSVPEKEYEETWTKAVGMLRAIEQRSESESSKLAGSTKVPVP